MATRRLFLMTPPIAGILILGGLLGGPGRAEPAAAATQAAAAPRFVYASGFQGVRYYANPGTQAAPAPRTARTQASGTRPRTVGPGVRDWTTGQRLGLHKPWLRSRG